MGEQEKKEAKRKLPAGAKITGPVKQPGFLERLVQMVGERVPGRARLVDGDIPYLRQFMNPDQNFRPQQSLRPTKTTIPRGLPVRQSALPDEFLAHVYSDVGRHTWEPYDIAFDSVPGEDGLGGYTRTQGKDELGAYLSLYDIWDFDSPNVNPLIGKLLHLMGQPYAVYDRFDYDPSAPQGPNGTVKVRRRKAGR